MHLSVSGKRSVCLCVCVLPPIDGGVTEALGLSSVSPLNKNPPANAIALGFATYWYDQHKGRVPTLKSVRSLV